MIPVNSHTLTRYAAHASLIHTMKNHHAPALSLMMISPISACAPRSMPIANKAGRLQSVKADWCCALSSPFIATAENWKSRRKIILPATTSYFRSDRPLFRACLRSGHAVFLTAGRRLTGEISNKKIPCFILHVYFRHYFDQLAGQHALPVTALSPSMS